MQKGEGYKGSTTGETSNRALTLGNFMLQLHFMVSAIHHSWENKRRTKRKTLEWNKLPISSSGVPARTDYVANVEETNDYYYFDEFSRVLTGNRPRVQGKEFNNNPCLALGFSQTVIQFLLHPWNPHPRVVAAGPLQQLGALCLSTSIEASAAVGHPTSGPNQCSL